MEEEKQAIVRVVEGASGEQIGERRFTDVKREENFKKEEMIRAKRRKRSSHMSTEQIATHPRFQGQAPCPARSESQHHQLCLGGEEMESEHLHDSFKRCKGKWRNKLPI